MKEFNLTKAQVKEILLMGHLGYEVFLDTDEIRIQVFKALESRGLMEKCEQRGYRWTPLGVRVAKEVKLHSEIVKLTRERDKRILMSRNRQWLRVVITD